MRFDSSTTDSVSLNQECYKLEVAPVLATYSIQVSRGTAGSIDEEDKYLLALKSSKFCIEVLRPVQPNDVYFSSFILIFYFKVPFHRSTAQKILDIFFLLSLMTLTPFFNADKSQPSVTFYGAVAPWKHDSPNGIDVADLIEIGSFCRNLGGKRGAKSSSSGGTPRIFAAIRHDNGLSAA